MIRTACLLLLLLIALPAWAQDDDDLVPLDAAPAAGELVRGRLGDVGPTLQPLTLHADGQRLQLKGWPADLARVARMTRDLRDLVGRELLLEVERTRADGAPALRVLRVVSPTPFEPREAVVAEDGSRLQLDETAVPYSGPVADLVRRRAQGRKVKVAGLQFGPPDGPLEAVYLTRVQAWVGWRMALLRNADGEAIGFVAPKTHLWLLGTSEDGERAVTRGGIQLKLQFPENPGLPWYAWLPIRVDRYAPLARFRIGEELAPSPDQPGMVDGLRGARD